MLRRRYLNTGRSPKKRYTWRRRNPRSAPMEGSSRPALLLNFQQGFWRIVKLEEIKHKTWSRSSCAPSLISAELGTDAFITQSLQPRLMEKRRAIVRMDENVFDVWQRHSSRGDQTAEVQLPAIRSG